ncbi:MAG: spore germination protein [Clostridia bacterium]|nr:spore germination protein [Clostridia bacterium]
MMNFTNDFDQNFALIREAFQRDDTLKIKMIRNPHHPEIPIVAMMSGAMVSNDIANRDVVEPLETHLYPPTPEGAVAGGISCHNLEISADPEKALVQLGSGDCIVLIGDYPQCIIIDTKGMAQRSNSIPETEISLLGPQDGFNENIMANLGLLKKRIASSALKCEFSVIGKQSNNKIVVCYLEGVVRKETVNTLKKRLQKIDIDGILDGNVLAELIRDHPHALFKTVGKTARPDVLAAKLLEGRVGVILDGSPIALTLPYIFAESFQSPDDYYQSYLYGNVGRGLRFLGFLIAVFLPAFYLAVVNFNPGILPAHWFYTVLSSSIGVPIHTATEMLILLFAFEILRETGTRMPAGLGLALNVVGAVILGDAAVNSNIVSTPMVIIVAFSGVTGLMVKDLKGAVFFLRLGALLAAAIFGLAGLFLMAVCLLLHLASLSSLGVPFLYTLDPKNGNQDTLIRMPYWRMIARQRRFSANNRRQKP